MSRTHRLGPRTRTILTRCCEVIALSLCLACHPGTVTTTRDEHGSEPALDPSADEPEVELAGSGRASHGGELRSAPLWRGDGFMPEPGLRIPVGFEPSQRQ